MANKLSVNAFLMGILLVFTMILAHAGSPLWTIIPLSATDISVTANTSATISYNITNQSHKSHQLTFKAIPGIVPIITSTSCSSLFTLGYQQSCRLNLLITGSALSHDVLDGPTICEQNNLNQCYQPTLANRLHITKTPAIDYTVGGSVFGLSGTLVLANNTNDTLILNNDGTFTFTNTLPSGSNYQVTIQQQPASQTCTVGHSSGTIINTNVTDIVVNCSVNARQIGGQVSGLAASQSLVLRNNNSDDLSISSNGSFVFPTPIAQGASYNVTVATQPNTQTCSVINGSGTAGSSDINTIQVNCATNAYSVGGSLSGLSGTLELQNNGSDNLTLTNNGSFVFNTPVADGSPYAVTILTQPATQTCTVNQGSGTINGTNITQVSINCLTNTTTLTSSVSQLALSVTGLTEYGLSPTTSGLARVITIRNTGGNTAHNLSITTPTWPSGTSSTTTCNSTLSSNASCTITITPGATATSDGTNPCSQTRTEPTLQTIQISADNASTISTNVVVLNYGCMYQGGFIYAFDDTTPNTSSVGGKIVSTSDQSLNRIWSSNGMSAAAMNTSDDLIPGINQDSTSTIGAYSYSEFTTFFSNTYTNTVPFTPSSFMMCNGEKDGACNTRNILMFYDTLQTNNTLNRGGSAPFTASLARTDPNFYAAGLCQQTIQGYSDWYLPAICEMGYSNVGDVTDCGNPALPKLQNMQTSLIDMRYPGLLPPMLSIYWSSTLSSLFSDSALAQQFRLPEGDQIADFKYQAYKVRCSRTLTP